MTEKILQIENEHISNVFGELDANVRRIEENLGVAVVNRGDSIKLTGPEKAVEQAAKILLSLEALSKKGERSEEQQLLYLLDAAAGVSVLTGGTDVHLVLVDLRNSKLDGQQGKNA